MENKLINKLADDVKKLGAIGTISYTGAGICFIAAPFSDFKTGKGWGLIVIGATLVIVAGVFYLLEQRAANRKEALGVLREVHNRLAEQTAKGTNEQTVSMTMTIAKMSEQIVEILRKI